MTNRDAPATAVAGVLTTRHFTAHPATNDNVAAYGTLLEPLGDEEPFGAFDAQLQLGLGTPRFYLMKLTRRPMSVTRLTRHVSVTQALASLNAKHWYVLLAPPDEPDNLQALPDVDRLQAFCITGSQALVLHRSTWHAGPYFLDAEVDFVNLELSDTNVVDHHNARLDVAFGMVAEIDV